MRHQIGGRLGAGHAQRHVGDGAGVASRSSVRRQLRPVVRRPQLIAQGHADDVQQVRVVVGHRMTQIEQRPDVLGRGMAARARRPPRAHVGVGVLQVRPGPSCAAAASVSARSLRMRWAWTRTPRSLCFAPLVKKASSGARRRVPAPTGHESTARRSPSPRRARSRSCRRPSLPPRSTSWFVACMRTVKFGWPRSLRDRRRWPWSSRVREV